MVLIPNTLELAHFWVTGPLIAEVEAEPQPRIRDRLRADPDRSSTGPSTRKRSVPGQRPGPEVGASATMPAFEA